MEINLETGLEHQQKAIDAIMSVFNNVPIEKSNNYHENPSINPEERQFRYNIDEIQKGIRSDYRNHDTNSDKSCLHIDVKMETGTGKTYVYTKTIYEMHKRLGFNRFIIVVPSLAIKAGTAQFIRDSYVQKHFSDACGYNSNIQLEVLESQKSNSKGRSSMPNAVRDFVWNDISSRKIYVLLINMQMLTNGKLLKSQYDQTLFNDICQPFEALRETKPVVIIDEPHRFSKSQTSYKVIMDELKPQILIRYGATFPEIVEGRGKNKTVRKDFSNLVYDLNACDSFNQGLIKGIVKEHINLPEGIRSIVEIKNIERKSSVELLYIDGKKTSSHVLKTGDALSTICDEFMGICIDSIGNDFVTLSNNPERELHINEKFYPDVYSTSYQEQMLKLALERHFETEIENFKNNIKTLALFFINDISSYRQIDNKPPFLKNMFEELLKSKIDILLKDSSLSSDYKAYLEATYKDIPACHAGYFAQDNFSKKDDVIAKEIDDILHNKKALLSFKKDDGTYNTRRFLFSKWTLKEGWDNPNVFTIAKLRSSGSEISKLQEVGRGLRLPVNNAGNRISNCDFKLNYIVDFSESDFAEKLVSEINGELRILTSITDDLLQKVAKIRNTNADDLFSELFNKKYIDRRCNIIQANKDKLFEEYPEFNNGLKSGKVTNRNSVKNKQTTKIKEKQFNSLKDLWNTINQKYYILLDERFNDLSVQYLNEILNDDSMFSDEYTSTERYGIDIDASNKFTTVRLSGIQINTHREVPYNQFLKRVCQGTSIPIATIHKLLCDFVKNTNKTPIFNELSIAKIISRFKEKKIQNIETLKYVKSNIHVSKTTLTDENGNPLNEISLGRIGVIVSDSNVVPSNYLYDKVAYDSDLEHRNIINKPTNVTVYGKIPRASISIPTILGENYSPDFMYVVQSGSTKEYNLVIETKDVESYDNLREVERVKINCAKKFFETLSKDSNIVVKFQPQLKHEQMQGIIDDLLNQSH